MKIFKSVPFIAVTFLLIGAGGMYFVQNFTVKPKYAFEKPSAISKPMDPLFNQFFSDESLGRSSDPFEEMRRMREGMIKQFDQQQGGGLFDSWFSTKFGGGSVGDIKRREDDKFVYYDISVDGLKPEKLKVQVEAGQLTISGQVEKKSTQGDSNSFFSSSFHRSLPVPSDVDASKVQMEQNSNKLTVKFPRLKRLDAFNSKASDEAQSI